MLKSYKDLKVWQKSFELCKKIYRVSRGFPADERFGLVAQVRRAAVSVPSNIAEGHSRDTTRDYVRFLWLARGSLGEIETQLMLARDLQFVRPEEVDSVLSSLDEVGRMLRGLIRSLSEEATPRSRRPAGAIPDPRSSPLDPRSSIPAANR